MKTVDVLVVGAGIAGAGLSYQLLELNPHLSVCIVEQESHPGYHSTGRSAAIFREISEHPLLSMLCKESRPFFERRDSDFTTHPLLRPCGVLYVALEDSSRADSMYETWQQSIPGLRLMTAEECCKVNPLLLPSPLAAGVLEPEAQEIDVALLHQSYIKAFKHKGGNLVTNSQVTDIKRQGDTWTLTTTQESYKTPMLVNASGAWADTLAVTAGVPPLGLQALRRTVTVIPGPKDLQHFPFTLALNASVYCKYESGNILLSPCDEHPQAPSDAFADDLDVAIAIDRFEKISHYRTQRRLRSWAGLRTFCPDRLPVLGEDTKNPGFFWLAGLGGFGIKTSPAVSFRAASLLLASMNKETLDNPFSPERLSQSASQEVL